MNMVKERYPASAALSDAVQKTRSRRLAEKDQCRTAQEQCFAMMQSIAFFIYKKEEEKGGIALQFCRTAM